MGEKLNNFLVATGKGAASLFPGGGFLAEYIGLAQAYVADKRMNEWKSMVEETLEKLPRSIEDLAKDEAFYSCIQVATMGAMRAYQNEKRKYFANALYVAATNSEIETDKKLFYLSLLSDYTLSHIQLLRYFSESHFSSKDRVQRSGMVTVTTYAGTESPLEGIQEHLPALANDTAFVKHITGRLSSDGLINVVDFRIPVQKERAREKRTTKYGDEFLTFIRDYE